MKDNTRLWNRNYILLFCAMVFMTTALTMNSAVITTYVVSLGYDLTVAGTIAGIMTIASMSARPVSGILGDILVKKKVVFITTVFAAVMVIIMAFPVSLVVLGIVRVVFGVLFSISTTVMMAMIPDCVSEKDVGSGLMYYGVGLGVAQAVGPSFGFWIANNFGYPMVYVAAGILTLVSAFLIMWLPSVRISDEMTKRRFSFKTLIAPELLPLIPGCFCIGAVLGVENSFLALYAGENSISNVGWYFTLYGVLMILIRLFAGRIINRMSFTSMFYGGLGAIAATFLLFSLAGKTVFVPVLIAAVIIRAFGIGIYQPALQTCCLQSVSESRKSTASGMYYLGSDLGMGLTPIIGAKIYELSSQSYPKMFLILMLLPLFAFLVFIPFQRKITDRMERGTKSTSAD